VGYSINASTKNSMKDFSSKGQIQVVTGGLSSSLYMMPGRTK